MNIQTSPTIFFPARDEIESALQTACTDPRIIQYAANFFAGTHGKPEELACILPAFFHKVDNDIPLNLKLSPLAYTTMMQALYDSLITCAVAHTNQILAS